jgi:hypothetical protein
MDPQELEYTTKAWPEALNGFAEGSLPIIRTFSQSIEPNF